MLIEVEDTLLIRQFFLETLDEVNEDLKKNNKNFRIKFFFRLKFFSPFPATLLKKRPWYRGFPVNLWNF